MSEYQYYEWQTIDRLLTEKEQAEVNKLSSHIAVSPTGAWVDYNWGDFKHDPEEVLAKYFDAFLYMADWGSRTLMFRFPKALIDSGLIDPYRVDGCVELSGAGGYWILSMALGNDDSASDWIEGSGWLSALALLRNDILLGDMRALYLAWLANVERAWLDEDELEPPVPAGLGKLTTHLNRLASFLEINPHLLAAAASGSVERQATPDSELRDAIARLPRSECDDFLWRLAQGEANLGPKLLRRLHELIGAPSFASPPRRTIGELLAIRDQLALREERKQQKAALARRVKELENLAQREAALWQEVDRLIQSYQPKAYRQAVALLLELRELAAYKSTQARFQTRLDQICQQVARRPSLMASLKSAGLVSD